MTPYGIINLGYNWTRLWIAPNHNDGAKPKPESMLTLHLSSISTPISMKSPNIVIQENTFQNVICNTVAIWCHTGLNVSKKPTKTLHLPVLLSLSRLLSLSGCWWPGPHAVLYRPSHWAASWGRAHVPRPACCHVHAYQQWRPAHPWIRC